MVFIVDTHALVWYLSASKRLSSKAKKILEDPHHSLIFPSIVLAEIKYLYGKRRIKVSFDEIRDVLAP
jgi:PIN domain nuclease of toxin-antitoxin system